MAFPWGRRDNPVHTVRRPHSRDPTILLLLVSPARMGLRRVRGRTDRCRVKAASRPTGRFKDNHFPASRFPDRLGRCPESQACRLARATCLGLRSAAEGAAWCWSYWGASRWFCY
jgi:hypothetical protein